MGVGNKHKFQSAKGDGPDTSFVRPSNWNADHDYGGGAHGDVLVRDTGQSDGADWRTIERLLARVLLKKGALIGAKHTQLTGTIAVEDGTPTLTGTGTAFTTELARGDVVIYDLAGTPQTFTILSVTSDTIATATANSNATATGKLGHRVAVDELPVGADGLFLKADSAQALGVAYSVVPNIVAPERRFGMRLSNNGTDADNDLDISAGEVASDDALDVDRRLLRTTTTFTKQLDATWASGTGAGGRKSGEGLADGWWNVFAFERADGATDFFFSQLADPTPPEGPDKKQLLGSIYRDTSAGTGIMPFYQDGSVFYWGATRVDVNAVATGTTAQTKTLSVPPGRVVRAFGSFAASAAATLYFSPLTISDEAAGASRGTHTGGTNQARQWGPVPTNTSQQLRTRSDANVNLTIETAGWVEVW